jgi:eukaryotic-like serine/threonine-protein kinase
LTATASPQPPSRLGPYEVGAKIAGGGMATVYIGRKMDGGKEQLVALKVIKDELAHDETFIHMFLDEAKVLSRLSHPNIIETLEYGVTGANRFIAMELLLGRSLMDVWERLASNGERVPIALGAWICARVAEGLGHAHSLADEEGQSLHVIHRDVNPSNIFLAFDGRVKLIDFGLAKMRNQRAKTGDGIVKGKVPYLSPEQILQDQVDGRSDLYSLGTTLWEIGAGKRLFKRDSDIATIDAIRQANVPKLTETVKDYPASLWAIVEQSLQPKPEARYATAGAMVADLDAFLGGLPEAERPTGATLAAFLGELFAGDEARQIAWLKNAKTRPVRPETMPPPIALPEVRKGAGEISAAERVSSVEVKNVPPAPTKKRTGKKKAKARVSSPPPAASAPPSRRAAPTPPSKDAARDRQLWTYASIALVVVLAIAALALR